MASSVASGPTSNGGKPRVLIVDDNRDGADTLALLLELENYEVRTAYNGAECVEIAQRFRPKLVLLDLDMPVMDGVATAKALRADRRGAVLVALSARCGPGTELALREAGFDMQICKPYETGQLLEVLRWFIARQPRRRDLH